MDRQEKAASRGEHPYLEVKRNWKEEKTHVEGGNGLKWDKFP